VLAVAGLLLVVLHRNVVVTLLGAALAGMIIA